MNLFIKSGKNLCVCELMDALQLPQYAISKALSVLKSAGFFVTEKEGTWIYYKLNRDKVEIKSIINFLKSYLDSDVLLQVEKRLQKRIALRLNDKCVIGIIPNE
ncbi:metalloregulator ArsR/SmtB family transcription factor [Ignavibacterium sp.]|uniref:ArsR/SmtB family transcription factor n=1 Tax=Ignavibacterium sp. TaxID=2651167 RepID=UPI00307D4C3C